MTPFAAHRVTRTWTRQIGASPDAVFPLLCPVREYDWIPTWECELLHSDSGVIEEGCVFRTDRADRGPEVWVVAEHDPEARRIGFVVNRGHDLLLTHQVSCQEADGGSVVSWVSTLTGLTDAGNRQVEAATEEAYEQQLDVLGQLLDHYCRTGEMLGAHGHV